MDWPIPDHGLKFLLQESKTTNVKRHQYEIQTRFFSFSILPETYTLIRFRLVLISRMAKALSSMYSSVNNNNESIVSVVYYLHNSCTETVRFFNLKMDVFAVDVVSFEICHVRCAK
jgi:hypothetical protein